LSRRCEKLVEATQGGAVHFPRAVLGLIDRAYALRRSWRGHRIGGDELAVHGLALSCELQELCERRFQNQANRRLGKHILKHAMSWFWFLIDPSIQSTNHWAERAIRPAVVNRKVWGGNRTWIGAHAQATLMSIIQTAKQRAIEPFNWIRKALTNTQPTLALR
jgi:transposase